MRTKVRRHLGKVVAGAAIAVAATAAMVAITLPGDAVAGNGKTGADGRAAAAGETGEQGIGTGSAGAVRPGVVEEPAAEGEKGIGSDPLTDDEMERAERIATSGQASARARNVEGERGPQLISASTSEVQEGAGAGPRRAELSYYDYKADTLVTKTVNLETGKVEQTDTQRGVQPPPTGAEAREAAELLIADPLGKGLKADYKDATSKALTSADQLTVTGMVYQVSAERPGPAALGECGTHRCVTLFTKVKNGPWIDTRSLVVDLSARKVGSLG